VKSNALQRRTHHSWRVDPEHADRSVGVVLRCFHCDTRKRYIRSRVPVFLLPSGDSTVRPPECTKHVKRTFPRWLRPTLRALAELSELSTPKAIGRAAGLNEKQAHTALHWLIFWRYAERVSVRTKRKGYYRITEAGRRELDSSKAERERKRSARDRYLESKRIRRSEIRELGWRHAYALGYPPSLCFEVAREQGVKDKDLPECKHKPRSEASRKARARENHRRWKAQKADDQLALAFRNPLQATDLSFPKEIVSAAVWLLNGKRIWEAVEALKEGSPDALFVHMTPKADPKEPPNEG